MADNMVLSEILFVIGAITAVGSFFYAMYRIARRIDNAIGVDSQGNGSTDRGSSDRYCSSGSRVAAVTAAAAAQAGATAAAAGAVPMGTATNAQSREDDPATTTVVAVSSTHPRVTHPVLSCVVWRHTLCYIWQSVL